jgi:hypothetical protein
VDLRSVRPFGGCHGVALFKSVFPKIVHAIRSNQFSYRGVRILSAGGHFVSPTHFHARQRRLSKLEKRHRRDRGEETARNTKRIGAHCHGWGDEIVAGLTVGEKTALDANLK